MFKSILYVKMGVLNEKMCKTNYFNFLFEYFFNPTLYLNQKINNILI